MRIILTAIITICSFVGGFAQTFSHSPENWQTVALPDEEFSVEAPVEMTLPTPHPKKDMGRTYFSNLNGTYFRIFSEKRSEADSIEKGLQFIRGFEKKGGRLMFGGINAEKFDFEDDEKFFHRVIYLETSSRAYLFHTISENPNDNAAKRFLRSLQVAGRPISGAGTDYDETPPQAQKGMAGTATASGTETGSGQGFGIGRVRRDGPVRGGAEPSTVAPAGSVQQVKLLSKPRASYTDLARIYYISGTVTLRITFLAAAEIGPITPVSRLPFGLTSQSIAAARAITFEPAQMNGAPFSKQMTIQYGFTIY